MKNIAYFREVLANEELLLKIIKDELLEIKGKYADERKNKDRKESFRSRYRGFN